MAPALPRPRTTGQFFLALTAATVYCFRLFICGGPEMAPALPPAADDRLLLWPALPLAGDDRLLLLAAAANNQGK